jgi:superfamily I DNA/RNA helicase
MTYELEYQGKLLKATEEQTQIIDFAIETRENILISALAGAAKTSTLQFLCKYLPMRPTLSIAFNKRIADEMAKRLPGHVAARTLNSVGHTAWQKVAMKRLIVNKDKSYDFLKAHIGELPKHMRNGASEMFAETLGAIRQAKILGYVPRGIGREGLIDSDTFWSNIDDEVSRDTVDAVIRQSIKAAYEGVIDFDDQVYMSTLFGGVFDKYPDIMVDEVQDLNRINHAMLELIVSDRLMAVGDPWQSIYAFRGALVNSMRRLREKFDMTEMTLSVSFRCPQAVVRKAQRHVPHMKWAEGAIEGSVRAMEKWRETDIVDGSAIICRNNAPLFSLALKLLKQGRGVRCVGTDLGPSLVRQLKRLGDESTPRDVLLQLINEWEEAQIEKGKEPDPTTDKADCFRIFAKWGATLGEAAIYAETLFKQQGSIHLLSGHKAKGLEWDTVYHLDPWRCPSKWAVRDEDKEQEKNVEYVITTRAKKELILVTLEGFNELREFTPVA